MRALNSIAGRSCHPETLYRELEALGIEARASVYLTDNGFRVEYPRDLTQAEVSAIRDAIDAHDGRAAKTADDTRASEQAALQRKVDGGSLLLTAPELARLLKLKGIL